MWVQDRETLLKLTGWMIHVTGVTSLIVGGALYHLVVSTLIVREQQQVAMEITQKGNFLQGAPEIRREYRRLQQQLTELEKNAVTMRQRIPEQPREAEFLKQVTLAADEEGVKILKYERGTLVSKKTHSEFDVTLSCEGNYEALCGFMDRLSQLSRVATVQRVTLTAGNTEVYPIELSMLLYYGAQASNSRG